MRSSVTSEVSPSRQLTASRHSQRPQASAQGTAVFRPRGCRFSLTNTRFCVISCRKQRREQRQPSIPGETLFPAPHRQPTEPWTTKGAGRPPSPRLKEEPPRSASKRRWRKSLWGGRVCRPPGVWSKNRKGRRQRRTRRRAPRIQSKAPQRRMERKVFSTPLRARRLNRIFNILRLNFHSVFVVCSGTHVNGHPVRSLPSVRHDIHRYQRVDEPLPPSECVCPHAPFIDHRLCPCVRVQLIDPH